MYTAPHLSNSGAQSKRRAETYQKTVACRRKGMQRAALLYMISNLLHILFHNPKESPHSPKFQTLLPQTAIVRAATGAMIQYHLVTTRSTTQSRDLTK